MKFKHYVLLLAILLCASFIGFKGYQLKKELIEPLGLEDYMDKSIFELPFLAKTDEMLMFYIEYADELRAELTEPTEPEEPAKQSNTGAILALVLILGAGGGAAYYFLVMKPKQAKNVPSDLDDFDLEDEEEYLTEE